MKKKLSFIVKTIFILSVCTMFIILAVNMTISFRYLYYFDIGYLKIGNICNLEKTQIKTIYNYMTSYITDSSITTFNMPYLTFSKDAALHFEDVKNLIYILNKVLFYVTWISAAGLYIILKAKDFKLLNYASKSLLITPVLLLIPCFINFDKTFTLFHKIFFNNNYWLFDVETDPVIYLLPQEFFLHCLISILFLIVLSGLILKLLYFVELKKNL